MIYGEAGFKLQSDCQEYRDRCGITGEADFLDTEHQGDLEGLHFPP